MWSTAAAAAAAACAQWWFEIAIAITGREIGRGDQQHNAGATAPVFDPRARQELECGALIGWRASVQQENDHAKHYSQIPRRTAKGFGGCVASPCHPSGSAAKRELPRAYKAEEGRQLADDDQHTMRAASHAVLPEDHQQGSLTLGRATIDG
jgi:hypothetical protein